MEEVTHFFEGHLKDALLLFAIIAIVVGEFKEEFRSKKKIRIAIIAFLLVTCFLQNINDKEESNKQLRQYQNTIAKGDTTIKKLNVAFSAIKDIEHNMDKQLSLQKNITTKANLLSKQNQEITLQQKRVYKNVERLLNPIFPLYTTMTLEVPFTNENIKKLLNFVVQKQDSLRKKHNYQFTKDYNVIYLDSIKKNLPYEIRYMIEDGYISIEQQKSGSASYRTVPLLALNIIDDYVIRSDELTADFSKREFLITVTRFDKGYVKDLNGITQDFGYSDLLNSYMTFNSSGLGSNYILKSISFETEEPVGKMCLVYFTEKDTVNERYKRKFYCRKIVYSNFTTYNPQKN